MSRTLTADALSKSTQQYGSEPIFIAKIEWGGSVGTQYYAGKSFVVGDVTVKGTVLALDRIGYQLKQDNVGNVGSITIELDDSEGDLKAAIDAVVVEKIPVSVLLHYTGNVVADFVVLFKGHIVSPVEWSEGNRILSLSAESSIEDQEIGFAPTEEDIPTIAEDAIGQPWPICFGSPVHVPAVRVIARPATTLIKPFRRLSTQDDSGNLYTFNDTQFEVEDGSEFPQNESIKVNVNGVIFKGKMNENIFTLDTPLYESINIPKYENLAWGPRVAEDPDVNSPYVAWLASYTSIYGNIIRIKWPGQYYSGGADMEAREVEIYLAVAKQQGTKVWFATPSTNGLGVETLIDSSTNFPNIEQVAKLGREGWRFTYRQPGRNVIYTAGVVSSVYYDFEAGTSFSRWDGEQETWVCNLLPSDSIQAVYAERDINGRRSLVPVPSGMYTKQLSYALGGQTCTAILMSQPLSSLDSPGWSDQLYVTLTSSEGPNTSDIIKYLLDEHSTLDTDASSFSDVQTSVANYPAHFAVFQKKNTIALAEEIAWQSRCALIFGGPSVKIKYLSTEPSADLTVDEDAIQVDSLGLTFTPTEDLVTRFVAQWQNHYHEEKPKRVVRENNVSAFGLREQTFEFYIYNIKSLVEKSATFWATRLGNVWRVAKLTQFLTAIKLEMFDTVALALDDTTLFNSASIKSVVHASALAIKEDLVAVELWLPSVAGTSSVHASAWLSDVGDTLPTSPHLKYGEVGYAIEEPPPGTFSSAVQQTTAGTAAPARIVRALAESDIGIAGTHLVNLYENGLSQPPTQFNVPATILSDDDPDNYGLEEDDPVTSFKTNDQFYLTAPVQGDTLVLGQITSAIGAGRYNWTKFAGRGTESGTAYEMNLSTGISNGTKVVLHRDTDGVWWFFFPIATC